MIVNYTENGWQIISQRTHGLLAGQICAHWQKKFRPERWLETIIATTEHDDAYCEFDEDDMLLNENGGPVNFKMRTFDEAKCDKLISHALTKSRYIALLISTHIRFLYQGNPDKESKQYCKQLRKREIIWMKEINITEKETAAAYRMLEWCDALSLIICQQAVQPEGRSIEISSGPDNQPYMLHAAESASLHIVPWPFEESRFEITYESRTLTQLTFDSIGEFRKILKNAAVDSHICKFARIEA